MSQTHQHDEFRVRVTAIDEVAERIRRFRLEAIDGALPTFSGGAHITVNMAHPSGRRIRNQYSLLSPPNDPSAYEIAVLHVADSRGGSEFMHTRVRVGDELTIGAPNNQFALHELGQRHLLFAGGIGITPFLGMLPRLAAGGYDFELHYAMRSAAAGAFTDLLTSQYADRVSLYRDDAGEAIPLAKLLESQPLGTHLYVCGPEGMLNWVLDTARAAGWPEAALHSEKFLSPPPGDPFEVHLARSQRTVQVGEHDSILEALEAAGVDAPYLCRGGVCGQCETRVVACDGVLEHNDDYLTAEERAAGAQLMICMSRFTGRELIVDL